MELFLALKVSNFTISNCCFKDHRSSISVTLKTSGGFFRDQLVPAHILSEALCCRIRTWWAPEIGRPLSTELSRKAELQWAYQQYSDSVLLSWWGLPSSLSIPSYVQIIFPLETSVKGGRMSPCPGASRPDSHSQLPEGLQGRHASHCPGSQGCLNTRRLSELDHLRLKFWGAFASYFSHFVPYWCSRGGWGSLWNLRPLGSLIKTGWT